MLAINISYGTVHAGKKHIFLASFIGGIHEEPAFYIYLFIGVQLCALIISIGSDCCPLTAATALIPNRSLQGRIPWVGYEVNKV